MPQLSLYLDDAEMTALRNNAKRANKSLSSYAREVLRDQESRWPMSFWKTYGALRDETFVLPDEVDESLDRVVPSFD